MPQVVLVIDDEMEVRTFVTVELEAAGYVVWPAESAAVGLARMVDEQPDLIALDVLMPRQSGLELYRTIKSDPELRDLPVLVISGMAKKTFPHALRHEARGRSEPWPEPEGYIEKPPGAEELLAAVKLILGRKK